MRICFLILFYLSISFGQFSKQRVIKIDSALQNPINEISGMAWYGDKLILVPQFPSTSPFHKKPNHFSPRTHTQEAYLYLIEKSDILLFLENKIKFVQSKKIRFHFPESINPHIQNEKFEGFEAIIFHKDTVFMTIEMEHSAYIVLGTIGTVKNQLTVDMNSTIIEPVRLQTSIDNMAEEALTILNGRVLSFHEVNSISGNPNPVVQVFNSKLKLVENYQLDHLNFRITDASTIDQNNRFWVLNYMYPNDSESIGPKKRVERLVEFEIQNKSIYCLKSQISIQFLSDKPYNWEGMVRFDQLGFLVINDKFPIDAGTTLLFVPHKTTPLND
jgi:hypothetical protein